MRVQNSELFSLEINRFAHQAGVRIRHCSLWQLHHPKDLVDGQT